MWLLVVLWEVACASSAWKPVERISMTEDLDLSFYVNSRTPVILENAVPTEVMENLSLDHLYKYEDHHVFVQVVPATHTDLRTTNFGPIGVVGDTREYGMSFGDLLDLLRSSGKKHPITLDKRLCKKHRLCDTEPEWERDHWYAGSELKLMMCDTLGPHLIELVEPFPKFEMATGLDWRISATIMRGATSGTYYPAHFDCYPNLLQNFWGSKNLRMIDLKPLFAENPKKFEDYNRIQSLVDLDFEKFPELLDKGYIAELKPRDILYIPSLWLHDVLNLEDSLGCNRWYTHKAHADIALCEFLKEEGPRSVGGSLSGEDVRRAVELSQSKPERSYYKLKIIDEL